jgi:AAA domain
MALSYTPETLATAAVALQNSTPSTWIVDGLLRTHRKRPSLLVGLAESGKSTLATQMAICVAQGKPFLGRPTTQGRVIYWKNEESEIDVHEDFVKAGMKTTDPLTILLPEMRDHNLSVLRNELAKYSDTRLVIVETLADFFNIEDINDSEDGKRALQDFSNMIVQPHLDCAFLIIHHFNKSNLGTDLAVTKINGTHALATGTDAKLFMSQVSDEDQRRIIWANVRKGLRLEQTYLNFDTESRTSSLGVTVRDEKISSRQIEKSQRQLDLDGKILQLIEQNPGTAKWEIVMRVGGNAQRLGIRIDELIRDGFIVERPGGGKGNAKLLYREGAAPLEVTSTVTREEQCLPLPHVSLENKAQGATQ